MNKGQRYTKAYNRIKDSVGDSSALLEDLDTINELVIKEMPKRPIILNSLNSDRMYHFECPVCHKRGQYDFPKPRFMYCGQAFRSDEMYEVI